MHRTIVPGEMADKTLDHLRCESTALEETPKIEDVARILAIHRRDELAALKFRRGQNRHG